MERTYIADIKNNLGKPVLVQGFVENLRDSKYMAFIVLKDITGKIQITGYFSMTASYIKC